MSKQNSATGPQSLSERAALDYEAPVMEKLLKAATWHFFYTVGDEWEHAAGNLTCACRLKCTPRLFVVVPSRLATAPPRQLECQPSIERVRM